MTLTAPGPDSSAAEPDLAARLAIRTEQSANRCVLWLRGSLCSETVSVLDGHVDRLGCRWCDEVVVDLGGVALIDGVGARLIAGFGHYVAARGGRFSVRAGSPSLLRMIEAAETELGC